MFLEKTFDVGF